MSRTLFVSIFLLSAATSAIATADDPQGAIKGINAATLALIVNDDDPKSIEVADYYQLKRHVPDANVIHVHIPDHPRTLTPTAFKKLQDEIDAQLPASVQALLMVWTAPYAVACNSITSAMTLGFDAVLCQNTCGKSSANRYYNSPSLQPHDDFGIRPSMLLPIESVTQAKALIDRGLQSEFRVMPSSAWFLVTSDKARNSRSHLFPPSGVATAKKLTVHTIKKEAIADVKDVMIYETGLPSVPQLETLNFRPGALADHLTSSGGDLLGNAQMSSLRWLEAGATASYGSVSEPCNFWQKFPNPTVLTRRYLSGDSAIEAYWKSVAWPAQGVFIGEPLARPYRR